MIKSMTLKTFLETDPIYAKTVERAFEKYPFRIISGAKEQLYGFLYAMLQQNKGRSFVDFYYANLPKENKIFFEMELTHEEKEKIKNFEIVKDQVYYELTEDNLGFLAEITAQEWLFSTFYFGVKKAMVWGNYGLKYPIFCESEEILQEYMQLAEKFELEINK